MAVSPAYILFPLVWITLAVIVAWCIALIVVQRERIQNPLPAAKEPELVPPVSSLPTSEEAISQVLKKPLPSASSVWGKQEQSSPVTSFAAAAATDAVPDGAGDTTLADAATFVARIPAATVPIMQQPTSQVGGCVIKARVSSEIRDSPAFVAKGSKDDSSFIKDNTTSPKVAEDRKFPFLYPLETLGTSKTNSVKSNSVPQSPAWPVASSGTPSLVSDFELDESQNSSRASTPKSQASSKLFTDDTLNASFSTTPSMSPTYHGRDEKDGIVGSEKKIPEFHLRSEGYPKMPQMPQVENCGFVLGGRASILQNASEAAIYDMQTVSVAETVTLPNRAFTIDQAMYEYLGEEGGKLVTRRFPFANFFRYGKLQEPEDAVPDTMIQFRRVLLPGIALPAQKLMDLSFTLASAKASLWVNVPELLRTPRLGKQVTTSIENVGITNKYPSGMTSWKSDTAPRKQKIIPWYLKRIGVKPRNAVPLDDGFNQTLELGKNVLVYVLDGAITENHRRLNVVGRTDFCPTDSDSLRVPGSPLQTAGSTVQTPATSNDARATAIAGIIGARESLDHGMMGVCPGLAMHSIALLDKNFETDLAHLLAAFEYILSATALGRNQQQLSTGLARSVIVQLAVAVDWSSSSVLMNLAAVLAHHKILIVQPASGWVPNATVHSHIITVGSYNQRNRAVDWSDKHHISIWAPGDELLTTAPDNGYAYASGPVMASAVVTGILARYLGAPGNTFDTALAHFRQQLLIGDAEWYNPRIAGSHTDGRSIYVL